MDTIKKIKEIYTIEKNTKEGNLISTTKVINRNYDEIIECAINELETKIENKEDRFKNMIITDIKNTIKSIRSVFPDLFKRFDYCTDLKGAFTELNSVSVCLADSELTTVHELKNHLHHRLNAFYLNREYSLLNTNTLAISHLDRGWEQYSFELSEDFNFISETNFGFGCVSYFYSVIKYKNIILAPFSDIVVYPHAKYKQIINYSAKHCLKYSEWASSFNFICENYYSALKNERAFLDKYLIKNSNRIGEDLKKFMTLDFNSVQTISDNYKVLDYYEYSTYNLLGEKYCESIKVLKLIEQINIKKYYDYYYNLLLELKKDILSMLEDGVSIEIPKNINLLETKKIEFKQKNYEILKNKIKNRKRKRKTRKNEYFYSEKKLEEYLSYKYEDYLIIEEAYLEYKKELYKFDKEISINKEAINEIPNFIKFKNKKLVK
ncbi:hypothetical protein AST99_09080 [Formosa algae]|uniref:hypothetical protein n=1 Tax=Formosa algae TaxID=225843 RepID=UPI000708C4AB|nr:hypothetical protein [Formosa algae]OEI80466.1 hypothetical protein AST99_09080 [Formosa algae]